VKIMKKELISTLKTAEINFLMSIMEIDPSIITKQIQEDVNHIAWIFGHCVSHFDNYLAMFTENAILAEDEDEYYSYGVKKEKVRTYPFSFRDLVEKHLKISERYLQKLESLSEAKFKEKPNEEAIESLADMIKRLTLHIMGHTGQIVILRRMFGNPYWSFVGGIQQEQRSVLRKKWNVWWNESKNSFD